MCRIQYSRLLTADERGLGGEFRHMVNPLTPSGTAGISVGFTPIGLSNSTHISRHLWLFMKNKRLEPALKAAVGLLATGRMSSMLTAGVMPAPQLKTLPTPQLVAIQIWEDRKADRVSCLRL